MIWVGPISGTTYYWTSAALLEGDLVEDEGRWYRVLKEYDRYGEDPHYWYYVVEVA